MRATMREQMQRYSSDPAFATTANAYYSAVLSRSAVDGAFRQKLLTEPRAALAEFNGCDVSKMPESLNIVFIENNVDATIVLPDLVSESSTLSEAQLETVSGGTDTSVGVTTAAVAAVMLYDAAADWIRAHTTDPYGF
ncbi:MAG TPA: hypothetical protein VN706_15305 [Gemmatimonadaceae bacterium]|nr:hypothetical protein [Gemmatimonadaceae bacterium]